MKACFRAAGRAIEREQANQDMRQAQAREQAEQDRRQAVSDKMERTWWDPDWRAAMDELDDMLRESDEPWEGKGTR